ncbi:putative xanthine dehydrogenase accessory factor [delta proteobacterium NaphS2]|nr:putative xanthine dehydrogenase accessory factor [delta proteobacterium NaphS2]
MIDVFEGALKTLKAGESVALATIVRSHGSTPRAVGAKMLVFPDGRILGSIGGGAMEKQVIEEAKEAIRNGLPKMVQFKLKEVALGHLGVCGGENDIFIDVIAGKKQLIIVGAGHLGRQLSKLGAFLGMDVVVFDDRSEYANEERFPDAREIIVGDVKKELEKFPIHAWSHVVIVTRGHELDGVALETVIRSQARYLGMIGSRTKKAKIYAELLEKGIERELLDRVHAPIGLDIGAETPEEIAIAIMAEIISVGREKI